MTRPGRTSGFGLTTVTAHAVLGAPQEPGGRADDIARRLEDAICLGLLRDGDRLPAEAQLAAEAGVATVTLREALAMLRRQGLIETRRGRGGGTFVRMSDANSDAGLSARLHALSPLAIREFGDLRRAISGTAAALAAERAVTEETVRLGHQVDRLRRSASPRERGRADAQLSVEIAAASQSSRLTAEEIKLRAEIGELLWWQISDADHAVKVGLRRRLVGAISRRHPVQARKLAEQCVAADTARLQALRMTLDEPATATPGGRRDRDPRR